MDLQEKYKKEVVPKMRKRFEYKNDFEVPRIQKAVVNTGIGKFAGEKDAFERIAQDLAVITSQKSAPTKARKAIASFKVREGMIVGNKVTLRGKRMYDFISRLVNVALPRIRDFRGISPSSIDPYGNLTIGIQEHIVFPEIKEEQLRNIFGLEITLTTSAKSPEEAEELFRLMGFPIKKESD